MPDTSANPVFEPLPGYHEHPPEELEVRSRAFAAEMQRRRTTRHFSDRPVARSVIEACLEAAGTAPSGAHLQPWHFVVVSDPDTKRRIRLAAEAVVVTGYPAEGARVPLLRRKPLHEMATFR